MIRCEIKENGGKTMKKTVEVKGSGNVILNEFSFLTRAICSALSSAGAGNEEIIEILAKAAAKGVTESMCKEDK